MAKGKPQSGAFDLVNDGKPIRTETEVANRRTRAKSDTPALRGKTVMFQEDLRRPLKMAAYDERCSESDVINRLLDQYLKEKKYL